MVLLGDESQVEACFGPFGDSATRDARLVHGLRRTFHRLSNRFGRTNGTPRCMVYAEHTISLEIDLDALVGTPR